MKKLLKNSIVYISIALAIWITAVIISRSKGLLVAEVAYNTFVKAGAIIIAVFIIIGLLQVWISPKKLSKVFGKEAGWKGLMLASTIPLFIGGSLFTMFPLLKTMKEKGASSAVILTFIVAWGGKVPLLPLEIEFLGLNFAILRILLIIPLAIFIGKTGEISLEKWNKISKDKQLSNKT